MKDDPRQARTLTCTLHGQTFTLHWPGETADCTDMLPLVTRLREETFHLPPAEVQDIATKLCDAPRLAARVACDPYVTNDARAALLRALAHHWEKNPEGIFAALCHNLRLHEGQNANADLHDAAHSGLTHIRAAQARPDLRTAAEQLTTGRHRAPTSLPHGSASKEKYAHQ